MKKRRYQGAYFLLFLLWIFTATVYGKETPRELRDLYARSAVLMDGGSGRILFGKNETEVLPMASTTKIMTCILALEQGSLQETVTVSANAASQPEVRLGMREGEQYRLCDLLYSLMLESHNDSAVAIAEHVGGSVEGFAAMMNEKAKQLGCESTHYVTPNGLDGSDAGGEHATTAADLAAIMAYCVGESPKREEFMEITQTRNYRFTDLSGKRSFSCSNHNAFLDMRPGVLSGKTGFTSAAGYCYVCALESEERVFVVALLACGWPYNKTYKWADTRKLMDYAAEHFERRFVEPGEAPDPILVEGGLAPDQNPWKEARARLGILEAGDKEAVLLEKEEKISRRITLRKKLMAPVEAGTVVGKISCYLGEELLREYPVVTKEEVPARYFEHWLAWIWEKYML